MHDDADPEPEPSLDLGLFDSAAAMMCVRDMQGRLVRVNKAWEATLGLSITDVQKTSLLPLIHPADVPATLLHMAQADQHRQVVDFVNRYRRRDGEYRYIQWRAQRLGNVVLGRAHDVTAQRKRQDQLRDASQMLEETLADIGDRVRAPSDEILAAVKALGQTELTGPQRAMLQTLGRSVDTLAELVDQLIERERLAAWAAFWPNTDRHRMAASSASEVDTGLALPYAVPRRGQTPRPSMLDGPSSVLQDWIVETSQHVALDPEFHRNFRDLSSQILGLLAIRLGHLGQFYPRRLQDLSVRCQLMGAGRAATLLARMHGMGFVDVAAEFQAGQIRPYRVQPAMTQAFAGLLTINLKSLAASDYRAVLALKAIEADGTRTTPLLAAFALALLDDLRSENGALGSRLNGVPLTARGQDIALAIAADAIEKRGADWEGWIEISLTSYARRFEVSRVHVRRVIMSLAECGLVRDLASPSRLLLTSRFRAEIENYRQAMCSLLAGVLTRLI